MSVREVPVSERNFGLMRALDRFKGPASRVLSLVGEDGPEPSRGQTAVPRPPQSASRLRGEQVALKSHTAMQEGLELWPLPGLAPMTRVRTSFGDVHAIALRKGDQVLTRGGGYMPILWINRIMLDEHVLRVKPDSNPIQLARGALGPNAPSADMMVSPRQIVCADEKSGLTSSREAAMLISRPGIRRIQETGLSYTMLHVGEPADIFCEGLFLRFPLEA